jgi:hypothetical protein
MDHIQYAIAATGAVNMVSTGLSVPFIDRFGRIPLLIYPLLIIIFNFILLTIFLNVIKIILILKIYLRHLI